MTGLRARIEVRQGGFTLELTVAAAPGTVTAVLGPNGAGKSTLLRCLAGQLAVDRGRIVLDGRVLDEPPHTFVPPEDRRVGVVHQEYLLFPHLSALENVAFGPRSRGVATRQARAGAQDWLARMGLAELVRARPRALSGGQQQRVALARALATEPAALLLDEPLAALDARTRPEVRRGLRRHLDDYSGVTVLVTHDVADAVSLAGRMVVLEDGRVTHEGVVAEVLARPRTRYVAELVRTNLLTGIGDGATVEVDGVRLPLTARGPVFVTLRPEAVTLQPPAGGSTASGPGWESAIARVEALGDTIHVLLDRPQGLTAAVPVTAAVVPRLLEGMRVRVEVRSEDLQGYPRE